MKGKYDISESMKGKNFVWKNSIMNSQKPNEWQSLSQWKSAQLLWMEFGNLNKI